jgi:molybdate transport system substrate-binding protein
VRRAAALAVALALALPACGDDGESTAARERPRLVVSAASSMTEALGACGRDYEGATVRLSFGGSDELAAQIRQGVKPDVYAAANTKLPGELNYEGLLGTPVEFATNELVLAVPRSSDIDSLDDLTREDVELAIGSESVPIGSYTRELLGRLPSGQGAAILAKVRSNEPDVRGIVGKLTQRAADAGFVYVTDVKTAGGELESIELPRELRPTIAYAVGVVEGAKEPKQARAFVDGLLDGPCADALADAGFGPPPR